MRGQAHRVLQPAELRHPREQVGVCPWPGDEHRKRRHRELEALGCTVTLKAAA